MALDKKDIEAVEQIIYKSDDDMAVHIARSFERLEERMEAAESRILTRISEGEDALASVREGLSDTLGDIRMEIRGLSGDE